MEMPLAPFLRLQEFLSVRKRESDLPALRALLEPAPEVRVLDIGGGAGTVTERYAVGCGEIVVLEPNPRKIALGRSRRPRITFREGRAEDLPFSDRTFDRIVAIVSFHHVENPVKALAEIRRVLKPDGRLILFELHPESHGGAWMRVMGKRMHGTAPHFYEPEALRETLAAHGFHGVTAQEGVHGYFVIAAK